ncbi:MAG TPA: hypothetical protein VEC99_15800 [Clostridia bacterium]|nr:hypothetical protein [Clostridia bacterium]
MEPNLIAQARGAWWWNEAPSRFDVADIKAGAKQARDAKCSGYIPSLECYSYVTPKVEFGEPWLVGRRQIPFGFGWLKNGENPYSELPVRAIRLAYHELSANPDLPDAELKARLGRKLFGADWQPAQVDDLFTLFEIFNTDRDWSVPGALTTPGLVRHRANNGRLDAKKRALLRDQLSRVQSIATRYRESIHPGSKELHRIAQWIAGQWTKDNVQILEPK